MDSEAGMGKACTNEAQRVQAAIAGQSALPLFAGNTDVGQAGILFSLPALMANGLLRHSDKFKPDDGYYTVESVFLSLAFLALLRAKTLAQSETMPAGELGKVIGLDRIPEVKTLRGRIARFCKRTSINDWALLLSKEWMDSNADLAGILYIDGHVNIYSGEATEMPKRYVSRLRLCMSGSTDYWVNDHVGQPFFVVSSTINTGMIDKLRDTIVPRLNKDVPNQPDEGQLKQNALLSKYMIVCDREVYSPDFFYDLWQERVAICTYKKNVSDKWGDEEFTEYEEVMPDGQKLKVTMAERGVLLQNKEGKKPIWCREIRKRSASGHQTAIITTNYLMRIIMVGIYMFARWSQENFFKYMMEHFDIDGLVSYSKENITETAKLINPEYRTLDSAIKRDNAKLVRKNAAFAAISIKEQEEKNIKKYIAKKSALLEEIEQLKSNLLALKATRKDTDRTITYAQLPDDKKFTSAINVRKHFMDTIKMIAYRSETAMANLIKPHMKHPDEARKLIRQLYQTDADIKPDYENKTLTVNLHRLNNQKDDKIIAQLCKELNETQTIFPGTDMVVIYQQVSY